MSLVVTFLALLLVLSSNNVTSQEQQRQSGGQALPCGMVLNNLSPCLSYLERQCPSPSSFCCQGAKYVWKQYGKNKKQRQGVCKCLESILPLIGQVDGSLVSALPKQCGLKIKLPPISASFNCSQIH